MASKKELSHIREEGKLNMVDIGAKSVTRRRAVASCEVKMASDTLQLLRENMLKKGDALQTARIAGVMAAKKAADLIPLCHSILLSKITVDIDLQDEKAEISAIVMCEGKTGVEMEALTACSVAALTLYDMCKAVDKLMVIGELKLVYKSGGKSGEFKLTDE
ncbi:MAG: cyclic pyranopterin monophosphate synthase MoaC [Calditrichaeota bacterium]|nr:MAG: cyclic pyranopterin monophosphate synthase MoaC [Calditrichota bacterium]